MKKIFLLILLVFSIFCFTNKIHSEDISLSTNENELYKDIKTIDNSIDSSTNYDAQVEYKPAFFKMFIILIALLTLIFITFYMLKRLSKMRNEAANLTKNIKVIERRAISPKTLLYLIEVDGKRSLVSESSLEVRKIKDLDEKHQEVL
jgi:flagellar biogenesis protein FliO